MVNFETRPSFSIRIFTRVDIFAPEATIVRGCSHSLWNRSWSIDRYQANSETWPLELPGPSPVDLSAVESFLALVSFFASLLFSFASAVFSFFGEGLGVAVAATVFLGVAFGVGLALAFGEGFGDAVGAAVGLGVGFGVGVAMGVGDGSCISLLAKVGTAGSSCFSSLGEGVSISAAGGVELEATVSAAALFIQTMFGKFEFRGSLLPRVSAKSTAR
jgi:hypothetical protein